MDVERKMEEAEEHHSRQAARYQAMVEEAVKSREAKSSEVQQLQAGLLDLQAEMRVRGRSRRDALGAAHSSLLPPSAARKWPLPSPE
jgi:hypothetical protein